MPPSKVIVVTGASKGLGAGLVERFRQHGHRIGACARSMASSPSGEDSAFFSRALDVTDAHAVEAFAQAVIERLGPIDVWINNAGVLEPIRPLADIDPDAFRRLLDVNVMGVVHGTQTFVRHRRAQRGGGALINISSGAAQHGVAGWSAYCASKGAVDRLSEAVALEVADEGIMVRAVAPGVVDTDMQAMIRATSREDFPALDRFLALKADGHFNTPAFVADQILALLEPDHSEETPAPVVVRVPNEWESG